MDLLSSKGFYSIVKTFYEIENDYDFVDILEGSPFLVDLNCSITSSSLRDDTPGFE